MYALLRTCAFSAAALLSAVSSPASSFSSAILASSVGVISRARLTFATLFCTVTPGAYFGSTPTTRPDRSFALTSSVNPCLCAAIASLNTCNFAAALSAISFICCRALPRRLQVVIIGSSQARRLRIRRQLHRPVPHQQLRLRLPRLPRMDPVRKLAQVSAPRRDRPRPLRHQVLGQLHIGRSTK